MTQNYDKLNYDDNEVDRPTLDNGAPNHDAKHDDEYVSNYYSTHNINEAPQFGKAQQRKYLNMKSDHRVRRSHSTIESTPLSKYFNKTKVLFLNEIPSDANLKNEILPTTIRTKNFPPDKTTKHLHKNSRNISGIDTDNIMLESRLAVNVRQHSRNNASILPYTRTYSNYAVPSKSNCCIDYDSNDLLLKKNISSNIHQSALETSQPRLQEHVTVSSETGTNQYSETNMSASLAERASKKIISYSRTAPKTIFHQRVGGYVETFADEDAVRSRSLTDHFTSPPSIYTLIASSSDKTNISQENSMLRNFNMNYQLSAHRDPVNYMNSHTRTQPEIESKETTQAEVATTTQFEEEEDSATKDQYHVRLTYGIEIEEPITIDPFDSSGDNWQKAVSRENLITSVPVVQKVPVSKFLFQSTDVMEPMKLKKEHLGSPGELERNDVHKINGQVIATPTDNSPLNTTKIVNYYGEEYDENRRQESDIYSASSDHKDRGHARSFQESNYLHKNQDRIKNMHPEISVPSLPQGKSMHSSRHYNTSSDKESFISSKPSMPKTGRINVDDNTDKIALKKHRHEYNSTNTPDLLNTTLKGISHKVQQNSENSISQNYLIRDSTNMGKLSNSGFEEGIITRIPNTLRFKENISSVTYNESDISFYINPNKLAKTTHANHRYHDIIQEESLTSKVNATHVKTVSPAALSTTDYPYSEVMSSDGRSVNNLKSGGLLEYTNEAKYSSLLSSTPSPTSFGNTFQTGPTGDNVGLRRVVYSSCSMYVDSMNHTKGTKSCVYGYVFTLEGREWSLSAEVRDRSDY